MEHLPPIRVTDHHGEFFKILQGTPRSQIGVMTLAAHTDSGPEETHDGDQIVYVIEGQIDLVIEERTEQLAAGVAATIPARSRHHLYNRTDVAAFLLTFYAPPSY